MNLNKSVQTCATHAVSGGSVADASEVAVGQHRGAVGGAPVAGVAPVAQCRSWKVAMTEVQSRYLKEKLK